MSTIPRELQDLINAQGGETAALLQLWNDRGSPTEISNWTIDEEHRANLQTLVNDSGSLEAAVQQLFRDNYRTRQGRRAAQEQIETLQTQINELQTAAAAANTPGSFTLDAEQAGQWRAYQELGTPADVQDQIQAGTTAQARIAEYERADHIRQVADAAGYNAQILTDRDQAAGGLEYEILQEAGEDGQPQRRVVIRQDGGDAIDLHTFAQEHWGPYLSILSTNGTGSAQGGQAGAGTPQGGQSTTTTHIRQHGGSGQGSDLALDYLRQRQEAERNRPNPLRARGELQPASQD